MTRNFLVLNDNKTEVLQFTSRFAKNPSIANITAGEAVVNLVPHARDLGVILDTHITMRPHINNITRSASFALKKIRSIRKYLDRQSCEKLVHAFIYLLAWTIVIVCSSTSPIRIFANFNVSNTHLPALLLSQKKTGSHHPNRV